MSGHSPHPQDDDPQRKFDAEWRDIVENIGDLDHEAIEPDANDFQVEAVPPEDDPASADYQWDEPGDGLAPTGARDWSPAEEDVHFVQPDPGPVKAKDPIVGTCWAIIIAAALALFLVAFVFTSLPTWILWVVGAALIGACVTLVVRLPWDRKGNSDDSDGAVV